MLAKLLIIVFSEIVLKSVCTVLDLCFLRTGMVVFLSCVYDRFYVPVIQSFQGMLNGQDNVYVYTIF